MKATVLAALALMLGLSAIDTVGGLIVEGAIRVVRAVVVVDGDPPPRCCCHAQRRDETDETSW
jgi:hypothetical protein